MKNRKPVHQEFLTVAKSLLKKANEWRDTLYYGGVAVATATAFVKTGDFLMIPSVAATMREGIRCVAHLRLPHMLSPVATSIKPRTPLQLGYNALTMATIGMIGIGADACRIIAADTSNRENVQFGALVFSLGFLAATMVAMISKGSGLCDIIPSYREVMWDAPRRRDKSSPPNLPTSRL